MRTHSIKMFIKYLGKNKLYTFVTLSGFSISLMFVLLLSIYIKQELSVDQFHENKDRIYRLVRDGAATFAPPIGDYIKNQLPEVESYTRLYQSSFNATFKDNRQERVNFILADSSFFTMFSFKLENGTPSNVMAAKNSALLSTSYARKLYGGENPVGYTFSINKINFTITGIFEDLPENTHIQKCDAIFNFNALADIWGFPQLLTTRGNSSFGLYFLAKSGTNLPSKAHIILEQFKKDYWVYSNGFSKTLGFEPLTEVYFSKESGTAIKQNRKFTVIIFAAITLSILIIAIVNYINLTVAHAGFRAKETAIKKIVGCSKVELLWQSMTESIILSLIAGATALVLAFFTEPFFNSLMNCQLNLDKNLSIASLCVLFGIIAATGIFSGIVPAIVINSFKPLDVIKGTFTRSGRNIYSKVLIAFQYCIAIILLISTLTIAKQSEFMKNYNLGFNKENLFWMENTIDPNRTSAFRNILKSIPGVIEVSYCRGTPLDGGNNMSFNYKGKPVSFQQFEVDSVYLNMMGMKINNSSAAYSTDGVWINKAAARLLDLGENPVSFKAYDNELPILGIIEDFNFKSLHTKIGPVIVVQLKNNHFPWSIIVKLSGTNQLTTINRIRKEQESFTEGIPMDSGFMDESLDQLYVKEIRQTRLIGAFTILSIIISSMGIFAMALYYIQKKVKEIGIRKINGARVKQIVFMLNKEFIFLVAIAFIIATPLSGFIMQKWLQNFAYTTELSWWIFAIAGFFAILISLFTISWQSWRAAIRNPIEAVRHE